jgi:hypothetical protein
MASIEFLLAKQQVEHPKLQKNVLATKFVDIQHVGVSRHRSKKDGIINIQHENPRRTI